MAIAPLPEITVTPVAYITTGGGRTAPPEDGIVRRSAVLRAEFGPGAAGKEG